MVLSQHQLRCYSYTTRAHGTARWPFQPWNAHLSFDCFGRKKKILSYLSLLFESLCYNNLYPNSHRGWRIKKFLSHSFCSHFFAWRLFLLDTRDTMVTKYHTAQRTVEEECIKQIITQINEKLQAATLVPSFRDIRDKLIPLLHDDAQNIWNFKSWLLIK